MLIMERVVLDDGADRLAFALGDIPQAVGDLLYRSKVDVDREAVPANIAHELLGRRMRSAIGERRRGGVDDVDAKFDGAARCVGCKPR